MPPVTALSVTPAMAAAVPPVDVAVADPGSLKSSCQTADDCGVRTELVVTVSTESLEKGVAMLALLEKIATCDDEGVAVFFGDVAQGPVNPAMLDTAVALSLSMKFRPDSRSQKWAAIFTDGGDGESTTCGRWDALRATR